MNNGKSGFFWMRLTVLIKEALRKWRFLLVMCLAGLILGAGFQSARLLMKMNAQEKAAEEALLDDSSEGAEEDTDALDNEELIKIYKAGAEAVEGKLENRIRFLESSIQARIDPYHTAQALANITVSVKDDDASLIRRIIAKVNFYLTYDLDWTEIAEEQEVPPEYFCDIVSAGIMQQGEVLFIKIRHYDEEQAQTILDYVLKKLEEFDGTLQAELGEHEYIVLNRTSGVYVDGEKMDWTESYLNRIQTLANAVNTYNEQIKALEGNGTGLGLPKEDSIQRISKKDFVKSVLKFGIFGTVGGGAAGLFLILLILFGRGCCFDPGELRDLYEIRLLAVSPAVSRHRHGTAVDRLVDRIGRYPTEELTDEERYAVIAEKIRQLDGKREFKKIALIGDVPEAAFNKVAEALNGVLPEMQFSAAPKVAVLPESIRKVGESDGVILVAARGKSRFSVMDRQIETVRELDRGVIGGISVC